MIDPQNADNIFTVMYLLWYVIFHAKILIIFTHFKHSFVQINAFCTNIVQQNGSPHTRARLFHFLPDL